MHNQDTIESASGQSHQSDRHNAIHPFVLVKAICSPHCGWMPAVHSSYKRKRDAVKEANVILRLRCPYCRIEKWPNADGGEVVVCEFGVNPGIDAGVSEQRVMWAS